jgi:hypothetical protein
MPMGESLRLVQVGTAGGAAVMADVSVLGQQVQVVLTADYMMIDPPGFPFRPSFTGTAVAQFPKAVPNGSTLWLLNCEAAALIAAGGAVLAGQPAGGAGLVLSLDFSIGFAGAMPI